MTKQKLIKKTFNKSNKTKKFWLFPIMTSIVIILICSINNSTLLDKEAPFIYKMYE